MIEALGLVILVIIFMRSNCAISVLSSFPGRGFVERADIRIIFSKERGSDFYFIWPMNIVTVFCEPRA